MKKFQKISAAVLATGLVVSSSFPAFANDTVKVDSSNFETVNLQDALNNLKDQTTSVEDLQTISTSIPLGYLANNIFALSLNIEKINNPTAKAALQRNIEKAIAKWEEKNKEEIPTTEDDTSVEKEKEKAEKEAALEAKKAEEKAALEAKIAEEKAAYEAKLAEQKAAKEAKKAEKAAKKAEKALEKEERNASKQQRKDEHHTKKEGHKKNHGHGDKKHNSDRNHK